MLCEGNGLLSPAGLASVEFRGRSGNFSSGSCVAVAVGCVVGAVVVVVVAADSGAGGASEAAGGFVGAAMTPYRNQVPQKKNPKSGGSRIIVSLGPEACM